MSDKRYTNINKHMNTHRKKILALVKKERVVSSSEVAKYIKVSWNTADKYLLELAFEGILERKKKEGVTLWMKKV